MNVIEELDNKMLNMEKLISLSSEQQRLIMDLFEKLIQCFSGRNGTMTSNGTCMDLITAKLIYNSLVEYDYLISRRDKRIEDLLDK